MKCSVQKIIYATLIGFNCALANAENATSIIPAPVKVEASAGQFQLTAASRVLAEPQFQNEAKLLVARLRPATGFALKIKSAENKAAAADIVLTSAGANAALGAEGYELSVSPNGVIIRATTSAGIFYGTQSLLQMLPPEIFSTNRVTDANWQIPGVQIEDQPRFVWRGFMLDVSRHFFTQPEVERVLDLMALYKLNTFHWHLVDDQGWRIQIKKYPKLTSVGAWRAGVGFGLASNSTTAYDAHGRYGGFYTQKQIREIVAYAAARHVTIVPEIEMPGHSSAALVAYPQFATVPGRTPIPLKGGVNDGVYNAANDGTFVFLDNVLTEVFQLFPGKYIHIGGDEVPSRPWENNPADVALMKRENLKNTAQLESWFIRRIEKFVNAHGKTLIGWSEIAHGGLAPSAVVMDWIGGGLEAASAGHDVVMTPTKFCYFDHYQSTNQAAEPKAIGGYLPLERVYEFDPMPENLAPEFQSHILGGQANLWEEYIPNIRQVEYMMFPRLGAMAEVDWSPKDTRDWTDFQTRTALNEKRLAEMNVNYRPLSKGD